jgi:hypothetical protein
MQQLDKSFKVIYQEMIDRNLSEVGRNGFSFDPDLENPDKRCLALYNLEEVSC